MFVIKRDGKKEEVSFDKVLNRIKASSKSLIVNPTIIAQKVLAGLKDGIHTQELDELATRTAISLTTSHPDYGTLASRIAVSNHQKTTDAKFSVVVADLANQANPATGEVYSSFSKEFVESVAANADALDAMIDDERDFLLDFFGFKTLEKAYLYKGADGRIRERPQHLWMRVAVALWPGDLEKIKETYDAMSLKKFIHATPTLFNTGTPRQQLSSCYLLSMDSDSIGGIFKTLSDCAMISKYAGGIGLHIHNIRAKGSVIRGTNGNSNGIVPMLRVFNNTARYVDQCFTPETLIVCANGETKEIANITEGDLVLTSGGSETNYEIKGKIFEGPIAPKLNKVTKRVEHVYTGSLATVVTDRGSINVTPFHPFLVKSVSGVDYKPISELVNDDMIVYPHPDGTIEYSKMLSVSYKDVYDMKLYDLEIEGTHDYCVAGLGIAHNGGGKRNGSFAIYLEPWHADIEDFLKLKLNQGSEEERARDLFYALWVSDLFMKRVESGGDWTLFCPSEAPGLADVWGDEFEKLYLRYEAEGRGRKIVSAQKLWFKVLEAQIETGTPYLLYKDACNAKSNQQNLGTIKSSNLCVAPETIILTREGEVEIQSVSGKEVEVWNGVKWSKTTVQKTGEDQPLIKVEVLVAKITNENKGKYHFELREIECTHYHKFIVEDNDIDAQNRHLITDDKIANNRRVEAQDLKRGMRLVNWMGADGYPVESLIWSVRDYGRTSNTYCFNESENHAGVFNGILTGNCSEIIEYSDQSETAVCNLGSLSLPSFVNPKTRTFDFEDLRAKTTTMVRNLNRVIDINFYPTPETERSNMRHRPIGIGVQGLADVFALMRLPWESEKAAELNQRIFANMYYAAAETSSKIAEEEGAYSTFAGSPASKGKLQPDLWGVDPSKVEPSLDWDALRRRIMDKGLRNSLLVAPMPTASTSQILGNTEAFEPTTSNIYTRRTLAGEFIMVNKYLLNDLMRYDIWSEEMKNRIIANNGSVQGIPGIPVTLQELYKTAWEIKQKTLIDMAADRGAFICQSQSLNLFMADPTFAKLTSMHFYGWKRGLKTGQYYLRSKAPVVAQKFTVDPELQRAVEDSLKKMNDPQDGCLMCSG
jgi:ribonucleotide reductase alpha subunit